MTTTSDFGVHRNHGLLLSGWLLAVLAQSAEPVLTARTNIPPDVTEVTFQSLAAIQQNQVEAAKTWTVFHEFQFADRVERSGIRFEHRPVDDAAKNYKAVHYDHGTGLAAADVDSDGRVDLYFVNQRGGNQLWRNLGNGRFEDITGSAGVGLTSKICVAASFGDVDNDGLPDLLVTTVRMGNSLFRNLGEGRFQDITADSGLNTLRAAHSSGAVFFDFNLDGLLDLFIANVGVYTTNDKGPGGFYLGRRDAFLGWQFPGRSEGSVLYQNLGNGKFADVSRKMGLEHRGWSGDASSCDLNQDGFPDLYVLSMAGENKYYENQRGAGFVDKTSAYFPRTPWGSMGLKFFDYNLDGRMDLYVTDMHSDMTSAQIQAGQTNFSAAFEKVKSDVWCSAEWSKENQRKASNNILGNAFFRNPGTGPWPDVSAELGTETFWPWGVTVADLNADGYEDILVTAGMGYPLRYAINSVLLNDHGKRFLDSEFVLGVEPRRDQQIEKEFFELDCGGTDARHPLCQGRTETLHVYGTKSSRSSLALDLDDDGDLDLVTNEWSDRPQVLISNLSEHRKVHFLQIQLVGTKSNRDGLGATVKVRCGDTTYTRVHDGKSGYLSQSALPLYFGLGPANTVDMVEVVWPSGQRQVLASDLAINRKITITEPR